MSEIEEKKQKLDAENDCPKETENSNSFLDTLINNSNNFPSLEYVKTLSEDTDHKRVACEVKYCDVPGVLLLEQKPIAQDRIKDVIASTAKVSQVMRNDVYGVYDLTIPQTDFLATIVHPATSKHIAKFSQEQRILVQETPELYEKLTKPVIAKACLGNQWIQNVLDKKCETERILWEDQDPNNGFMMCYDYRWDGIDSKRLHVLAIVKRYDITCLRDLNSSHLPLLENIKSNGAKAISAKYKLPENELRIFIHYQPSYYHFHVHFTWLGSDSVGGPYSERSHLIDNVIANIRLMNDYYQKATITFALKKGTPLYESWVQE